MVVPAISFITETKGEEGQKRSKSAALPSEPQVTPDAASVPVYHSKITPYLNQIICGDAVQTMKLMPSESVDLIVTSPPYNLKNSSGNGMKDPRGGK